MHKGTLKERAIKNSFWSATSSIINRIGALLFTIILARFLMPENYGIYSIVFSIIMIFYTFADLGINPALTKYIAASLSKNKRAVSGYYHYLLRIKFLLTFSVFFLILILAYPLSEYVFKDSRLFYPLIAGAFYMFALTFDSFYTWLFYAVEKVNYVSIKETIAQTLRIFLPIAAFLTLAEAYHIVSVFIILILIYGLLVVFSLFYLRKLIPAMFSKPLNRLNKVKINKFIGYLALANIATALFSYIDAVILGFFLQPEFVGYYRASLSITTGIAGLAYSQSIVFLPLFAKLKTRKRGDLFNKAARYLALFSIPLSFGLIVLGRYFIKMLYGEAYIPASWSLYFLALLIFPAAMVYIIIALFSAAGKPKALAKIVSVTCILSIILNLVLIKSFSIISPTFGTVGAAIATLLSWTFYLFIGLRATQREFSFSVNYRPLFKALFAGILMAGVILLALHYIQDVTIFIGAGLIIFGASIYFILLFMLKEIKKEDLQILREVIRRKIK